MAIRFTSRPTGRLVFSSRRNLRLWKEQTIDCGPELREFQWELRDKLDRVDKREFDAAVAYVQAKYPRNSWVDMLLGGEIGNARYDLWLDIFQTIISQFGPQFPDLGSLLDSFIAITDELIKNCKPLADFSFPCGPCLRELQVKFDEYEAFIQEHYRRHRESYPSPGWVASSTIEPGLIAEILVGVLLTAILAILISKLPPPLFQVAAQLVRGARPALATALTGVVASVIGSAQDEDIQQLVDRVRLSQEFSDLADQEAQSFLEQLLPPPSIACPPLEGVIEDALTQVTSENPAIPNPCENARIVNQGATAKIDQLRQAYGEGCPRAELLLQDLRQAIEEHCSS